jgi:hypothetical protein
MDTIRRRGKIAQLPDKLREHVNEMIRSNAGSKAILAFLAAKGHPGINHVNISHWTKGDGDGSSGYNDWLREQQALAALQASHEFARQLISQNQELSIHEAGRLIAASQLIDLFAGFDVASLRQALTTRPESYARLVNAITKLSRDSLEHEKFQDRLAEQKRFDDEKLHPHKSGFSEKNMKAIQEMLGPSDQTPDQGETSVM